MKMALSFLPARLGTLLLLSISRPSEAHAVPAPFSRGFGWSASFPAALPQYALSTVCGSKLAETAAGERKPATRSGAHGRCADILYVIDYGNCSSPPEPSHLSAWLAAA